MTATAHSRGHPIHWDGNAWVYEDGSPLLPERPCARCGRPPTPEGHDHCLGILPGVTSACCGHGVADPILLLDQHSAALLL